MPPGLWRVLGQMEPTAHNPEKVVERGHALEVQGRMVQMIECFLNVSLSTVT